MKSTKLTSISILAGSLLLALPSSVAFSRENLVDTTKKSTETQIRHLVEPLLDKYCHEQCKLLSVTTTVEVSTPDSVAPGFDEVETTRTVDLSPTSARIKMLIDDKVGSVSRAKLLELIGQFLETLDYPVKIDTQLAHFPAPVGTESRIAELRERVVKQFRGTIEDLFNQFCREQCLLADFNVSTEVVNAEEAQYGQPGEFIQENGVAVHVRDISATLLMDDILTPEERASVLQMARLKTNVFKNVTLSAKSMRFPHPTLMNGKPTGLAQLGAGSSDADKSNSSSNKNSKSEETQNRKIASNSDSKETLNSSMNSSNQNNSKNSTQSAEDNQKKERFEHFEKIERVESGDAVQAELKKFGIYGLIFACSVISLLIFVAMASMRPRKGGDASPFSRVIQSMSSDPMAGARASGISASSAGASADDHRHVVGMRYEIERLLEEMTTVFAQQPKVAKQVFSRVLTEEGVETTAQYIQLFGESIVVDMLRDPSLQSDLSELMEFYAKNPQEMKDEEKLELLRKLHNRTVAGKLVVMGNRSSNLFDFLAEMDGIQILELVRNESLTVKSIVLTQVDPQKRSAIYSQLDEEVRMKLLTELSRIDYLPRDYIFNVANALKRKRRDNPRLNTEALPGSEVLVNLLERTGIAIQRNVVKNLEMSNPESARTVKAKLVSPDTLRFLRDGQLLEVVLSLRHDELLQFLKGAPPEIKSAVFAKSPKELIVELEEELVSLGTVSRETYGGVERKILNRMKMMANEGLINLVETNERMFMEGALGDISQGGMMESTQTSETTSATLNTEIKKVAGW
jgi:flagellar motor switch protein FliG